MDNNFDSYYNSFIYFDTHLQLLWHFITGQRVRPNGNRDEKIVVLKKNLVQKFNFKRNDRIVKGKVCNHFR